MEIRKAVREDAAVAASLAIQIWGAHTQEELEEEFVDIIEDGNSAVFLAVEEGEATGFAQCGLRHDYVEGTSGGTVGYLEGIFIKEPYRKKGIGSKLLEACEAWAKGMGCLEFASDCELENDISLQFHLHSGFQEANRIICFAKRFSDTTCRKCE
jgi:aminoglycoside 6'-N-acetyltransferase I